MDQAFRAPVSLADVLKVRQVIASHVWHTPLVPSDALDLLTGGTIHLKPECWQRTGSFKVRGALAKLSALTHDEWARGVVTASAGNHGLGVAFASQVFARGNATIFVPEGAPAAKVNRLETFDCTVRRAGADYDTAHAIAEAYAQERGAVYVSAYDDPIVIAGQGTTGLEIMEDLPSTDVIVVPVGGGGLVAGIAAAVKAVKPTIRLVGVQPEASPAAFLSLRDGYAHETYAAAPTICDGLAGGFGRVPFEMAAQLIDEIVVVPEADVRQAVGWLLAQEQLVVEGAGAIAVAALLNGQVRAESQNLVAVLTGRNIDPAVVYEILGETKSP
jgi:threonine dehydratase